MLDLTHTRAPDRTFDVVIYTRMLTENILFFLNKGDFFYPPSHQKCSNHAFDF